MYQGSVIELNLTPIPCCYSSTWETDVKPELIRVHFTADTKGDKNVDTLPQDIEMKMLKMLGRPLMYRLLSFDYLGIGIDKVVEAEKKWTRGGGAPYQFIVENSL
jgi:hypothetical protein